MERRSLFHVQFPATKSFLQGPEISENNMRGSIRGHILMITVSIAWLAHEVGSQLASNCLTWGLLRLPAHRLG